MNGKQLRELVIRPTLYALGLWSREAEDLLFGTACQESHCGEYIRQLGCNGMVGAFGIYQMEIATARDIYDNYLKYKGDLHRKVETMRGTGQSVSDALIGNLAYATAMARIHYLRVPAAIPTTLDAQADYWKRHYNTYKGKGTPEEYIENYKRFNK